MTNDVKTAMERKKNVKTEVRKILSGFLDEKGLRKTTDRFLVLDVIYNRKDHFDADSLYIDMKRKKYHISRATVYNTLEILLECNLIVKNQFGNKLSLFEKSYGYRQHDHLICVECRSVEEFCDPRIYAVQKSMEELMGFKTEHHSLNLFGICKKCLALRITNQRITN